MSTPLDEHTAWNLIRAVPPGLGGRESVRVHHLQPDVWLQVHTSGRWETSVEVDAVAHDVMEMYLPLQLQADLVVAQVGQSLDGRIATESGHSHYVTGPADIQFEWEGQPKRVKVNYTAVYGWTSPHWRMLAWQSTIRADASS